MNNKFSLKNLDPDIAELVPAYLNSRKADLILLLNALRNRDYTVIQHLAHNMKGVADSYGFKGLSNLGAALEEAAKEKNETSVKGLIADIGAYLNSIEL